MSKVIRADAERRLKKTLALILADATRDEALKFYQAEENRHLYEWVRSQPSDVRAAVHDPGPFDQVAMGQPAVDLWTAKDGTVVRTGGKRKGRPPLPPEAYIAFREWQSGLAQPAEGLSAREVLAKNHHTTPRTLDNWFGRIRAEGFQHPDFDLPLWRAPHKPHHRAS